MNDSDPLLRAVADGDPNCPDGRTLAALGDLFRRHATPPGEANDLSADILARLSDLADADGGADDQEAIDAFMIATTVARSPTRSSIGCPRWRAASVRDELI